ncbi:MAG: hypothetical protein QOG54_2228 [Actinomycetota bacterium]|jgi:iron-sulfur cluster repair protein YtfE (RIC family)|nr:hypothetical protein [Actinomycetota bacterium]
MTKRHETLIPLTHDHHHALAQARKLVLAADGENEDRTIAAKNFLAFYDTDLLTHFREEEEMVFPLAVTYVDSEPLLAQVMIEHLQIHALVHDLRGMLDQGAPTAWSLRRIADVLEKHIRFEEKSVFPLVEAIAEVALNGLTLAPRDRG